jgi:hypothetical protein
METKICFLRSENSVLNVLGIFLKLPTVRRAFKYSVSTVAFAYRRSSWQTNCEPSRDSKPVYFWSQARRSLRNTRCLEAWRDCTATMIVSRDTPSFVWLVQTVPLGTPHSQNGHNRGKRGKKKKQPCPCRESNLGSSLHNYCTSVMGRTRLSRAILLYTRRTCLQWKPPITRKYVVTSTRVAVDIKGKVKLYLQRGVKMGLWDAEAPTVSRQSAPTWL